MGIADKIESDGKDRDLKKKEEPGEPVKDSELVTLSIRMRKDDIDRLRSGFERDGLKLTTGKSMVSPLRSRGHCRRVRQERASSM